MGKNVIIDGIRLVLTCEFCPEQYDAFDGDRQIGYLRLRHGLFYAAYPDVNGDIVYEVETEGDGGFEKDERDGHLTAAVRALKVRDQTGRVA